MKSRTSVRNRSRSHIPSIITCSCGRCGPASLSPSIVRHGLNHSRPAVSVPMRASTPSEAMSAALKENRSESSDPVGLDLLPGRPHRGLLVRRVLELDQAQWKAVDEQHDVRPPLVLVLDDGELVDRQPVVVGGVLVVEDGDLGSAQGAAGGFGTRPSRRPRSMRWNARFRASRVGPSGWVSLRNASCKASAGRVGFRRPKAWVQPMFQNH